MTNELEPLDDDVRSLLRAAKPIADLEPTVKAAILTAVEARVGLPPLPGGGGSAGGDGGAGGGTSAGTSAAGMGLTGSRAILALAATFALGVVAGVGGTSLGRTAPSTAATVEGPRSAGPERIPSITPSPPAELSAAVAVGSLPGVSDTRTGPLPPAARVEPPAPSARGLAAERGVLDVARAALARGEAADALAAVERHEHEYPQGVLVEEREAIAVKALVALGRRDEARARAASFEERFPNGLMLHAVKGAVGDL